MKCKWCKCTLEHKHKLREYCDFCQKNQKKFINTPAKLQGYLDYINFSLEYFEDLAYEDQLSIDYYFDPRDLVVNGIVEAVPMHLFDERALPSIPIGEVGPRNFEETTEYRALSEFEYQLIRRLENVNSRLRISTTS